MGREDNEGELERAAKIIQELRQENQRLRESYIPFVEKHNELRVAVKQLFEDRQSKTFFQHLSWLERYIND